VARRFGLNAENCPKHPSNYTNHWVENDLSRGVTYYLLEADGRPQGCSALEIVNTDLCYLERLAVLPEARRKGFGQKLVEHVLREAGARHIKHASIGIIADQTELKIWYRRIGFVEGETRTFEHLPFRVTFMALTMNNELRTMAHEP
jgi:ribosomal protein S18 acetylase RimI-like enzyme